MVTHKVRLLFACLAVSAAMAPIARAQWAVIDVGAINLTPGADPEAVRTRFVDFLPPDVREFASAEPGEKISLPARLLTRGISILGDPGSGKWDK